MRPLPQGFVRFVLTPFQPETQPSLGVSSLCSVLRRSGIPCDVHYLNLSFGEQIGWAMYSTIGKSIPAVAMVGEVMFSPALWEDFGVERLNCYLEKFEQWLSVVARSWTTPEKIHSFAAWLRVNAVKSNEVVRGWADEVLAGSPTVVAFSSTFQQNVSSLALAKELRRRVSRDRLRIVFGGANCEGEMGRAIADNFPFVDCVVSGEGELAILDVVRIDKSPQRWVQASTVENLDELPIPNFDEYCAAIEGKSIEPLCNLVVESSRGCWWGEKSNCVFCGLNGTGIHYRTKNPTRFTTELRELAGKYGKAAFNVTDNIIPRDYPLALYHELAHRRERFSLFYETRVNLSKDELRMMAAAGIHRIQPGVESLSTKMLRVMRKGTTLLQNLQLLKWCEELKIVVSWNLLFGLPDEPVEEYGQVAKLFTRLSHLPPPSGGGNVQLARFGPLWKEPGTFRIDNIEPIWSYAFAYSGLPPEERRRMACFFSFRYPEQEKLESYNSILYQGMIEWAQAYNRKTTLELIEADEGWVLKDTRRLSPIEERSLSDVEVRLLKALDSARTRPSLLETLKLTPESLEELLGIFSAQECIVEDEGKLLSLVLDRSECLTKFTESSP